MRTSLKLIAGVGLALIAAPAAQAHGVGVHSHDLVAGLGHPFAGFDHLLAMTAVGVFAARQGGRALWAVPAAFATLLVAGGAMAVLGVALPGVEVGILASLVALGLLVAGAARLPLGAGLGVASVAALFHGHAHGSELPLATSPLGYGLGILLASLVLMGAGMALGLGTQHSGVREKLLRAGGVAMAATGLALLAA
jgi:urease accessory protein